jgi:hypothetical protein
MTGRFPAGRTLCFPGIALQFSFTVVSGINTPVADML